MNWQAGDIAILVNDGNVWGEGLSVMGCTCELIAREPREHSFDGHETTTWHVEINGEAWWSAESTLRKPYDGHETIAWSECAWQPDEVVTV